VVSGTYTVALDYGGQKMQQNFRVALDPRIHATQEDLEARLALDQKINADLDSLNKDINHALAARDKLQKVVSGAPTNAEAARTLAALNRDIENAAQMAMKASEGSLLHETKLRDHLAYLAADIDLSYNRPTAQQEAVFRELDQQAKQGDQKLQADVAEADKISGSGTAE
jgi:hypothetical protein